MQNIFLTIIDACEKSLSTHFGDDSLLYWEIPNRKADTPPLLPTNSYSLLIIYC